MMASEIKKMIYDRYPVTEKEKTCAMERRKRNYMRSEFKKRLVQIQRQKPMYDTKG